MIEFEGSVNITIQTSSDKCFLKQKLLQKCSLLLFLLSKLFQRRLKICCFFHYTVVSMIAARFIILCGMF